MQIKLLIVEDEKPIRDMMKVALSRHGFHILEAGSGGEGLDVVDAEQPDLILLDWMLPDMSGIDVAKKLKGHYESREIPIIMVTARGEEEDKIKGLEFGADDYITKPFSPKELAARIRAVLRRVSPIKTEKKVEISQVSLDPGSHQVVANGVDISLGPTEFKLLHYFMLNPNRVYNRTQLLDNVWGANVFVEERTVDVHIRRLRKALSEGGCDNYIQTVRGTGYRFSAPETE
ncbi:MAG: phosphate regulon transcriptional regulatory protein PhoB [Gammaproteobacteria bacterium]|nr:MAG: phosphate regulon transcriptional regulatory protein PhoB [Gammaproteobacteria bacterium]